MNPKFQLHADEGPPCKNMENLLQELADGSAKGVRRWYALAHAARCSNCGNFLERMQITVDAVKQTKSEDGEDLALQRLRALVDRLENQ